VGAHKGSIPVKGKAACPGLITPRNDFKDKGFPLLDFLRKGYPLNQNLAFVALP